MKENQENNKEENIQNEPIDHRPEDLEEEKKHDENEENAMVNGNNLQNGNIICSLTKMYFQNR